jgi:hypothetical protein
MALLLTIALLGGCGLGLLFLLLSFVHRRYGMKSDGTPDSSHWLLVLVLNGSTGAVAMVLLVQVMSVLKQASPSGTQLLALSVLLLGFGVTYFGGCRHLPTPGGGTRDESGKE